MLRARPTSVLRARPTARPTSSAPSCDSLMTSLTAECSSSTENTQGKAFTKLQTNRLSRAECPRKLARTRRQSRRAIDLAVPTELSLRRPTAMTDTPRCRSSAPDVARLACLALTLPTRPSTRPPRATCCRAPPAWHSGGRVGLLERTRPGNKGLGFLGRAAPREGVRYDQIAGFDAVSALGFHLRLW